MSRFFEWTPNDAPGFVVTADDDGWELLRDRYARGNAPLERLIEIAQAHQVQSIVIEQRYIDLDYRSEHSHFYSTTFTRYPSVCHRLHFFAGPVDPDLSNLGSAADSYKGYAVMRPLPTAPVGRTMIAPPPDLGHVRFCLAKDEIHLWGTPLTVQAMPFVSQDAQYLRCAHSAVWMVLYHAHRRHGAPRRLPHELHEAAVSGPMMGRQYPSDGLSVGQLLKALHEMQMSPGHLRLPQSRVASKEAGRRLSLFGVLCRYINSQMPPVVYSKGHAWVVVGYGRKGSGHDNIELYRHDDQAGPYLRVASPFEDEGEIEKYTPWKAAIPPLPQKVYLTGERAELIGAQRAHRLSKRYSTQNLATEAYLDKRMMLRTYAIEAQHFKAGAQGRLPEPLASLYRMAHWPRWVWVVEMIDRDRLAANESKVVLGEVVIDATASNFSTSADARIVGRNFGGEVLMITPDYRKRLGALVTPFKPYCSGIPSPEVV